ncbi:hypothetical protein DPV78_008347 [Talaromyces pinophilus]|nr:hypothetical protein DPV78_008347 [Talaromyces pinophilus]
MCRTQTGGLVIYENATSPTQQDHEGPTFESQTAAALTRAVSRVERTDDVSHFVQLIEDDLVDIAFRVS